MKGLVQKNVFARLGALFVSVLLTGTLTGCGGNGGGSGATGAEGQGESISEEVSGPIPFSEALGEHKVWYVVDRYNK